MEIVQALKDQRNFALVHCKRTTHWRRANEHLIGAVRNCTHPELHETEP